MSLFYKGRLFIGLFQGSQQALWRQYLGETSERVIRFLPEDQREKSTIKYTNFFIAFTVAGTANAAGPCKSTILCKIQIIMMMHNYVSSLSCHCSSSPTT